MRVAAAAADADAVGVRLKRLRTRAAAIVSVMRAAAVCVANRRRVERRLGSVQIAENVERVGAVVERVGKAALLFCRRELRAAV